MYLFWLPQQSPRNPCFIKLICSDGRPFLFPAPHHFFFSRCCLPSFTFTCFVDLFSHLGLSLLVLSFHLVLFYGCTADGLYIALYLMCLLSFLCQHLFPAVHFTLFSHRFVVVIRSLFFMYIPLTLLLFSTATHPCANNNIQLYTICPSFPYPSRPPAVIPSNSDFSFDFSSPPPFPLVRSLGPLSFDESQSVHTYRSTKRATSGI